MRVGAAGLQVVVGPAAEQVAEAMRAALRGAAPAAISAPDMLEALGGHANVRAVESGAGRLLAQVQDASRIDERALERLGARGVARASASSVQVIVPDAPSVAGEIAALLR